jgi:hypothetical protein
VQIPREDADKWRDPIRHCLYVYQLNINGKRGYRCCNREVFEKIKAAHDELLPPELRCEIDDR